MAEDQQKPVAEAPSSTVEDVVVAEEKPVAEAKDAPPSATEEVAEKLEPEPEGEKEASPADEAKTVEADKIAQSVSFKEESNVVGELPEPQKKALDELKALIQEALNKREFTAPPPAPAKEEKPAPPAAAASEEAVTEEAKKPEVVAAEESTPTEEAKKPEEAVTEPPKAEVEEKVSEPEPAPVAVVEEVVEKSTVVDEDGAKTVEAIEETIVSVSTPTPAAEPEPAAEVKEEEAEVPVEPEEVFIWGIPLLGDDKSDVILLKFLRARDFKAKDAFAMIKNTVRWRKEFGIEAILDEDLGTELEKVVFMQGTDKEGHPVCYNVYGEFQNKELYQSAFADEEKRTKFLKWRIQFLEKSISKLDFTPTGINTIVQVNDLKNSPGPAKRELRQATNQALTLLQDNYPEFVAKQVFINVPWWYLAFNRMISPFLTQRTRSKFVFAGPSKSAETLFKYIAPEQVPVQYGGLSRDGEQEFTTADPVTEVTIKPATKHTVEFPVSEAGLLVWEVRVVGWEVSYGAEFVPGSEDGYTVIVQKGRKIAPADEPVISNSFKVGEPGKVVLTFDNQSSKKKKLLYRSKSKTCSE